MKLALVTGITGQDGSFLAEFLLKKNYKVIGIKRRTSILHTSRVDNLYNLKKYKKKFKLVYGDLTDSLNIISIIKKYQPDEIYNLGAQSHVQVSFEQPLYTLDVNALGCLRILEAIRILNFKKKIKFYQASSSEMYGNSGSKFQNEETKFNPVSPYAASKVLAQHLTEIYNRAYGIHASSGILFNHESNARGETFVSRKITIGLAEFFLKNHNPIMLGNIYAKRDWGHAKDYVEMQWKILQQKKPSTYVISTGKVHTIKDFITKSLEVYETKIKWLNKGLKEVGIVDSKSKIILNGNTYTFNLVGKKIIAIDKKYYRPLELEYLRGDSSKAKKIIKWKPKYNFDKLVNEMVKSDFQKILNEK